MDFCTSRPRIHFVLMYIPSATATVLVHAILMNLFDIISIQVFYPRLSNEIMPISDTRSHLIKRASTLAAAP